MKKNTEFRYLALLFIVFFILINSQVCISKAKDTLKSNHADNFLDSIENEIMIISNSNKVFYKKLKDVPSTIKHVFPDIYFFQSIDLSNKTRNILAYYRGKILSPVFEFQNMIPRKESNSYEIAYCFALILGFNNTSELEEWPDVLKVEKTKLFNCVIIDTVNSIRINKYNYEVFVKSDKIRKILIYINNNKFEGFKDVMDNNYVYKLRSPTHSKANKGLSGT